MLCNLHFWLHWHSQSCNDPSPSCILLSVMFLCLFIFFDVKLIVNFVMWMTHQFPMEPTDVGMFPFALHFDAANCALMMFGAGAALYLHRPLDQLSILSPLLVVPLTLTCKSSIINAHPLSWGRYGKSSQRVQQAQHHGVY